MQNYYVDLHIHVGRTYLGNPVKITASRSLTIPRIIHESFSRKGMGMIGVIDCHVPEVLSELEQLIEIGELTELEEGGLRHKGLTIILGSEIEIYDENCRGPIHVLVYFPSISEMREFSFWLASRMKNTTLSSQRIYEYATVLQKKVKELDGLFIPAHIFTPFKSLYGKGVKHSLKEVLDPSLIDGIELGLSADTSMGNTIEELGNYSFLTNSDAHSIAKIGREYQKMEMKEPSFYELKKVLKKEEDRKITVNYGLNPLLGKYYHTVCERCLHKQPAAENWVCQQCGHRRFIKGVSERIKELAGIKIMPERPPYVHQVPLDFIPGVGPKTLTKLIENVGTEMFILHEAPEKELGKYVKQSVVDLILKARKGELDIHSGGGGKYGKVIAN